MRFYLPDIRLRLDLRPRFDIPSLLIIHVRDKVCLCQWELLPGDEKLKLKL